MKNIIKKVYEERYHFIDNFYLKAYLEVYKLGNYKQKLFLEIEEKPNQFKVLNSLFCIHSAVTTITPEEFNEMVKDIPIMFDQKSKFEELIQNQKQMLSTERKMFKLNPEESFTAFKSWVQGISEFGLGSIEIQTTIDQIGKFDERIRNFLVKGLMKISDEILNDQIEYVKGICRNFKVWDKKTTISNFIPILDIIYQKFFNGLNWVNLFAKIHKLDLPVDVFLVKEEYFQMVDIFEHFYT